MRNTIPAFSVVATAAFLTVGMARAADLTCANTAYAGFICLSADGITRYGRKNSPLRYGRATDIAACGKKIAVLSRRQVLFSCK